MSYPPESKTRRHLELMDKIEAAAHDEFQIARPFSATLFYKRTRVRVRHYGFAHPTYTRCRSRRGSPWAATRQSCNCVGAVFGTLPDADIALTPFQDSIQFIVHHRGLSHSLLAVPSLLLS